MNLKKKISYLMGASIFISIILVLIQASAGEAVSAGENEPVRNYVQQGLTAGEPADQGQRNSAGSIFQPERPSFGEPVDGQTSVAGEPPATGGRGDRGTITVYGYFNYLSGVPSRYTYCALWDEDVLGDEQLATTYTDETGYFSFGPVDNVDGEGGTQDIYVTFYAENAAVKVVNDYEMTLRTVTDTVDNVPDGAYDMGTWMPAESNRGAWNICDKTWEAFEWVCDRPGTGAPPQVVTEWYPGNGSGSYYIPGDKIVIQNDPGLDEWDDGVIMHEYGHYISWVYGFLAPYTPVAEHSFCGDTNLGLAWDEAWAHFTACAVTGSSVYDNANEPHATPACAPLKEEYNLETGVCMAYSNNGTPTPGCNDAFCNASKGWNDPEIPWSVEGTVACILWDIFDFNDDNYQGDFCWDFFGDGPDNIWRVCTTYAPESILDFWDGWLFMEMGRLEEMCHIYCEHGIIQNECAPFLTPTASPLPSGTPTLTPTATMTASPTFTPTLQPTATPTNTATLPPSVTPTNTCAPYYVSEDIIEDTTWSETSPTCDGVYHITASISIRNNAVLTIQEGVELRFESGCCLYVGGETAGDCGKLAAVGDEEIKIWITSDNPNPAPGQYRGIYFRDAADDSSTLSNCIIEYAGYGTSAGVYCETSSPSINQCNIRYCAGNGIRCRATSYAVISDCLIRNCSGYGVYAFGNSSPHISASIIRDCSGGVYADGGSRPVIIDNSFETPTDWPIRVENPDTVDRIRDNVFSDLEPDHDAIYVGGGTVSRDSLWRDQTAPYYLPEDIAVEGMDGPDEITTLTVAPGVIIYFDSQAGLTVGHAETSNKPGKLIADGGSSTTKIWFTRWSDSVYWDGITFEYYSSDDSLLRFCIIEHGGYGTREKSGENINLHHSCMTIGQCTVRYAAGNGIDCDDSSVFIYGTDIYQNDGHGIYACNFSSPFIHDCDMNSNEDYGIYISGGASPEINNCRLNGNGGYGLRIAHAHCLPTVTDCLFDGNGSYPVNCFAGQIGAFAGNTYTENACQQIYVREDVVPRDASWENPGIPYKMTGNVWVQGHDGEDDVTTVALNPGCELMFGAYYCLYIGDDQNHRLPGALQALGSESEKILFTADGDTPAPGGWKGIYFADYSSDVLCEMNHCIVEYGGYDPGENIYCSGSSPVISNTESRYASGPGVYCCNGSSPAISDCHFHHNSNYGIHAELQSSPVITGTTISNNSSYGVQLFDGCSPVFADCAISSNNNDGIYLDRTDCLPLFTGCLFDGNNGYPVMAKARHIGGFQNNTYVNNVNQFIYVWGDAVIYDSVWENAGIPYRITGDLSVVGQDGEDDLTVLTIEAGAELRFGSYHGLYVGHATNPDYPGALRVEGNAAEKVIFTADSDTPSPGTWDGLYFRPFADGTESEISHCIVEYAGYSSSYSICCDGSSPSLNNVECRQGSGGLYFINSAEAELFGCNIHDNTDNGITCDDGSPVINNCLISHNTAYGIHALQASSPAITGNSISENSSYGIYVNHAAADPLVSNNTLNDNGSYPLRCYAGDLDRQTGNACSGNAVQKIYVNGDTISSDAVWHKQNVPYLMVGDVDVKGTDGNPAVLVIEPGVEMQWHRYYRLNIGSGSIINPGGISVNGTPENPVMFTYNDGYTPSSSGEWYGIYFHNYAQDNICSIRHAVIEYAGYGSDHAVNCDLSSPTFEYCEIKNSHGAGIYCEDGSSPEIFSCSFHDNTEYGIYTTGIGSDPTISSSIFNGQPNGVYITGGSNPVIGGGSGTGNEFSGNSSYAVRNLDTSTCIQANGNWWGDAEGPDDDGFGSDGCVDDGNNNDAADNVSEDVNYLNWLTAAPGQPTPEPTDTPTVTCSPTDTPTATQSPTVTQTPEPTLPPDTPTSLPTRTPTATSTPTDTPTIPPTATESPMPTPASSAIPMNISEDIIVDTTWTTDNPHQGIYLIAENVSVRNDAVLTIEDGVEVRFESSRRLYIGGDNGENGELLAEGDPSHGILFTSSKTSKSPGQWAGIYFRNSACDDSFMTYCTLEYGGSSINAIIRLDSSSPTIEHCSVQFSSADGIYCCNKAHPVITECTVSGCRSAGINVGYESASLISNCLIEYNDQNGLVVSAAALPAVMNNNFTGNGQWPVSVDNIHAVPYIAGNSYSNLPHNYAAVRVKGGVISKDGTWLNQGIPYYIAENDVIVQGTDGEDGVTTLELEPGAVVLFNEQTGITVGHEEHADKPGKLIADGFSGSGIITFSLWSQSGPEWDGIAFNRYAAGESIMNYCVVEYGGYDINENILIDGCSPYISNTISRYGDGPGVYIDSGSQAVLLNCQLMHNSAQGLRILHSSSPSIINCEMTSNDSNGLRIEHASSPVIENCSFNSNFGNGLAVTTADCRPQITNCGFHDNNNYPVYAFAGQLGAFSDNAASGNLYDEFYVLGDTVSIDGVWEDTGVPYKLTGDIFIRGTDGPDHVTTLTIEAGVEVKVNPGFSIFVGHADDPDLPGALRALGEPGEPVFFTSASQPQSQGDWGGIYFDDLSEDALCELNYCVVEYGGKDIENITCYNSSPLISNTESCRCSGPGIYCDHFAAPELIDCFFHHNNNYGVFVDNGSSPVLSGGMISENSSYGFYIRNESSGAAENVTFHENNNHGLYVEDQGSDATITSCLFDDNDGYPVFLYADDPGDFYGNSYVENAMQCIYIAGGRIARDALWENPGIPYRIAGDVYVRGNDGNDEITSLNIEAGAVLLMGSEIKFYIGHDENQDYAGALTAMGESSNPVIFTADTDAPSPGYWSGIYFAPFSDPENSIMQHCLVEYGGYNLEECIHCNGVSPLLDNVESRYNSNSGVYCTGGSMPVIQECFLHHNAKYGVRCEDASPQITGCEISSNADNGIFIDGDSSPEITQNLISAHPTQGIRIPSNEARPSIIGNTFTLNSSYPVRCRADHADMIHDNNYINNQQQRLLVDSGNVSSDALWINDGIPYLINGDVTVGGLSGNLAVLTLEAGVELQFNRYYQLFIGNEGVISPGGLKAEGTPENPVIFTYNEGYVPPQESGEWKGVYFGDHADDDHCIIRHAVFEYGGYDDDHMIFCKASSPVFEHCEFRKGEGAGIYCTNGASPVLFSCNIRDNSNSGLRMTGGDTDPLISNSIITENRYGIYIENGAEPVIGGAVDAGNNIFGNTSYGVRNLYSETCIEARFNWWGDAGGPDDDLHGSDDCVNGGNNNDAGDKVSDDVNYTDWLTAPINTPTPIPSSSPTETPLPTETAVPTETPEFTLTPAYTSTAAPYTPTSTHSPTLTATSTFTATPRPSATSSATPTPTPYSTPQGISEDIVADTVWDVDNPWNGIYLISGEIAVRNDATLTIEPGVQVRFENSARIFIGGSTGSDRGRLIAAGTESEPVLFTSDRLDPSPGRYDGLHFRDSAYDDSSLQYCIIEYAGNATNADIRCDSASPSISDCTCRFSSHHGIACYGEACPLIENSVFNGCIEWGILAAEDSQPLISGNVFEDTMSGVSIAAGCRPVVADNAFIRTGSWPVSVDDVKGINNIENNTFMELSEDCAAIHVAGGFVVEDSSWANQGIGYYFTGDVFVRGTDGPDRITSLSIEPGTTLIFAEEAGLAVGHDTDVNQPGRLVAQGNVPGAPVVFTGWNELPGCWTGIKFNSTAADDSILASCDVSYATTNITIDGCSLQLSGIQSRHASEHGLSCINNASPMIENCDFSSNGVDGIYIHYSSSPTIIACTTAYNQDDGISNAGGSSAFISNCLIYENGDYGMTAGSAGSNPVVIGCMFDDNDAYPVAGYASHFGAFSGNLYQNNGCQKILVAGDTIAHDAVWENPGIPYKINGDIFISGQDGDDEVTVLTLEAGVRLNFSDLWSIYVGEDENPDNAGALRALGQENEPVIFTSDQECPACGDWRGIYFAAHSDDSQSELRHCIIEYGGYSDIENIHCYDSSPYLFHTESRYGWGPGIKCTENASPTLIDCNLNHNTHYGIYADVNSTPLMTGGSIWENSSYGIYLQNGASVEIAGVTVRENGNDGVHLYSQDCGVTALDCLFDDNDGYPVYAWARHYGDFYGNYYADNESPYLYIVGGAVVDDSVWENCGIPYRIAGNVYIRGNDGEDQITTLAIEPGVEIRMGSEIQFVVGHETNPDYAGILKALGEPDNEILFTADAQEQEPGFWNGIYFTPFSGGSISELRHCIVEYGGNGGFDNIRCRSAQPLLNSVESRFGLYSGVYCEEDSQISISNCYIHHNNEYGIHCSDSSVNILDSQIKADREGIYIHGESLSNVSGNVISENSDYGLRADSEETVVSAVNNTFALNNNPVRCRAGHVDNVHDNIYINNSYDRILVDSGWIVEDATWKNEGLCYLVLGDITVRGNSGEIAILTIEAGNEIQFNPQRGLYIGTNSILNRGGFSVEGTPEEKVTFTFNEWYDPPQDSQRWTGIIFRKYAHDDHCLIKHAVFEFGGYEDAEMICCEGSSPVFEHCEFTEGDDAGIYCTSGASPVIHSCIIHDNVSKGIHAVGGNTNPVVTNSVMCGQRYGVYVEDAAEPVIGGVPGCGNNIFENYGQGIRNIYSDTCIEAQYNWWGDAGGPDDDYAGTDWCMNGMNDNDAGDDVSEDVYYENWLTAPMNTPTPVPTATYTATFTPAGTPEPTESPLPTETPVLTATSTPTETVMPTSSPTHTATSTPVYTQAPTETPVLTPPPTASPEMSCTPWSFSGDITEDTTWPADMPCGGVMLLTGNVTIRNNAVLTIEDGVTVKYNPYIRIYVGGATSGDTGKLIADGSESMGITFTSASSEPYPGRIGGICFRDSADDESILDYCTVEYGGYSINSCIRCESCSPNITNCTVSKSNHHGIYLDDADPLFDGGTISDCSEYALYCDGNSSPVASNLSVEYNGQGIYAAAGAGPVIQNNAFKNINDWPIEIYNVHQLQNITGNTYAGLPDAKQAIMVSGGTISQDCTWPFQELPLYVDSDLTVMGRDGTDGITCLTIEPGNVLLFNSSARLTVGHSSDPANPGALDAQGIPGGNEIVFSGWESSPGYWDGITFHDYASDDSILDACIVEYGGDSSNDNIKLESCSPTITHTVSRYSSRAGLFCNNADPVVYDCEFIENGNKGISLYYGSDPDVSQCFIGYNESCAIYMTGGSSPSVTNCIIFENCNWGIYVADANSSPVVTGCCFDDNDYYPVRLFARHIPGFMNNSYADNLNQQIYVVSETLTRDALWVNNGIPYKITENDLTIQGTDGEDGVTTLTLEQGTVIEMGPELEIYIGHDTDPGQPGALAAIGTEDAKIVFTADTEAPVHGFWDGIYFAAYSDDALSELNHCIIQYGGYSSRHNLYCNGSSPAFYDTKSTECAGSGLYCTDGASPLLTGCDFISNTDNGIKLQNDCSPVITGCSLALNSDEGLYMNGSCSPIVNNCVFFENGEYGTYIHDSASRPVITGSLFDDNDDYPMYAWAVQIDNIYDNAYQDNLYPQIYLRGGTLTQDAGWDNPGIPYKIVDNVSVYGTDYQTAALTVESGTIMLFAENRGLFIGHDASDSRPGALITQGTSEERVVFAGDSEPQEPGYWNGLYFGLYADDALTELNYTTVKYGGYPDYENIICNGCSPTFNQVESRFGADYGIVCREGAQPSLNLCTVRDNLSYGIYCIDASPDVQNSLITANSSYGIYITGDSSPTINGSTISEQSSYGIRVNSSTALPVITNNEFNFNSSYPIGCYARNIDSMHGNSYINNGGQKILVFADTLIADALWRNQGIPYLINGNVTVTGESGNPAVLTIEPGVELQFNHYYSLTIGSNDSQRPGGLMIEALPENPVVFTHNDYYQPPSEEGEWAGLKFCDYAVDESCIIRNVKFEYGGYETGNMISCYASSPTFEYCEIVYGKGEGIYCNEGAQPVIHSCRIGNNSYSGVRASGVGTQPEITNCILTGQRFGVFAESGAEPVIGGTTTKGNNIEGNTTYGVRNTDDTTCIDATFNWWGDAGGPDDNYFGYDGCVNDGNDNDPGDRVTDDVNYLDWLDSPMATPTQIPTATLTPTLTPTPTLSPTATKSPTPTSSPTETLTPTTSPTNSPTITPTQTETAVPTNTPESTNTPTETPTNTPTTTPTNTPTNSPTETPEYTSTPTITPTVAPVPATNMTGIAVMIILLSILTIIKPGKKQTMKTK